MAFLYSLGGQLRYGLTKPQKADVPVICIGNLVAGGAGKTPVALAVIKRLSSAGMEVHALTRGYGGSERGPTRVNTDLHSSAEVGDEALLLAEEAVTWVSADRPKGARAASEAGAQVIVMDDGFQNPSLQKDLSLVVVDTAFGLGNGRVMPAGPLREPAGRGLARADAVILLGPENSRLEQQLTRQRSCLHLEASLAARNSAASLSGQKVLAFAGIGRPNKFYATLRELSAVVLETRDFPDHHAYTHSEVEDLLKRAAELKAVAITTEKDAVRLSSKHRSKVMTLPVEVVWQSHDKFEDLFDPIIKGLSNRG